MSNVEKITEPTTQLEATNQPNEVTEIAPPHGNRCNRNALVHGVYASELVLSFESAEDFERLVTDLKVELKPDGRQEEETVLAIARNDWLKHRLMRAERMAFRKNPMVAELEKAGVKSWVDVENFAQQKGTAANDTMDEVKKTLQDLQAATKSASGIMTAEDKDTQKIFRAVEGMKQKFDKLMPVYQRVYEIPKNSGGSARGSNGATPNAIDLAYDPDHLEKLVRLDGSIDARTDKLLQRLFTLKECKRFARQCTETIASPSIAPPVEGGNGN